jgi:hypothetical protein
MTFKRSLQFIIAATVLAAGSAHANLVVNGSFEATVVNGAWKQFSAIEGWTSSVAGNSAFEIQKGGQQGGWSEFNAYAADGIQFLELNTESFTSVSQTVATTGEGTYSLSFAFSGRPGTKNNATSKMNVYWGDVKLNNGPLVGHTKGDWDYFSIDDLVAMGPTTTLRFESFGPVAAPTYGSYLDAVQLDFQAAQQKIGTDVPEPGSIALVLLGLAGLGATTRRRK